MPETLLGMEFWNSAECCPAVNLHGAKAIWAPAGPFGAVVAINVLRVPVLATGTPLQGCIFGDFCSRVGTRQIECKAGEFLFLPTKHARRLSQPECKKREISSED
ncbi:MAG TPA: hypothetical protein DDW52_14795 [Planctomycetaceae bacterium]|nr:hypothetical protein [Planctomycetaceae bacterium]